MKNILLPAVLFVSLFLPALAITEAELAPGALAGKTLTFTVETGAPPFATSGSWTGNFGASPGNIFTKAVVTGDATNTTGTWTYNSTFSGMYEYTLTGFLSGQPDGVLTLWISGGAGRYEVFLTGVFGNSQTGGFTIGTAAVTGSEIGIQQPVGTDLADGSSKKTFGSVKVGKSGKAKTFTIKNTGTTKLTGLAVAKSGKNAADFTVTPLTRTSLAPGASITFKANFKPKAKGTKNAFIKIKSNDKDESPFDIPVTGTAVK
ncbi:MAG: choice-of-anchor D domain-containing protein [Verrucomicrobiota bacterium]